MKISTFLKKSVNLAGKKSSSVFLRENRNFLSNFPSVLALLVALDKGRILPTPCLYQVCTLMALEKDPEVSEETVDRETGEVSVSIPKKEAEKTAKASPRKYSIFIFAKDGSGVIGDTEYADTYQDAERKAHRRLFHHEDSSYASIMGLGIATAVKREVAMAELLKRGPGGVQATRKVGGMSTAPCATVKNHISRFSGC